MQGIIIITNEIKLYPQCANIQLKIESVLMKRSPSIIPQIKAENV